MATEVTGESADVVVDGGRTGVTAAVRGARDAQRVWAAVPVRDRAAAVLRLHDRLLARRDELTAVVAGATGKTPKDAMLEVVNALQVCRYYGVMAPRLLRPRRHLLTGVFLPVLTAAHERRVPVGVVGNIAAWNYPLVFLLGDTVPSLVAGNAVVLKPDPRSVAVAEAVRSLAAEAGFPSGLVVVVPDGAPEVAEALVDAVDHVLFTGSTRVGRLVAERAGRGPTGVTLELGGKNAAYVADDADLTAAVDALVEDCFLNAGQSCTATERLYVHATVHDEVVHRLAARTRALRPGTDESADVGPLVSAEHLARVDRHVRDAVARGARILAGGRARPELGPTVFEPTVLTDVSSEADVAGQETFGPVVSVYRVGSDAEAVARMGDTDTGLMASVWTRDVARGRGIARQLRVGTVIVNEVFPVAWGSIGLPLGGVGSSGLGRRYGLDGLREVTRGHVTVVQRTRLVRRLLAAPHQRLAGFLFRYLAAQRALRRP